MNTLESVRRPQPHISIPKMLIIIMIIIIIIIIIINHDFLPTPRIGIHVKSDKNTHTVIKIYPLAHILDT